MKCNAVLTKIQAIVHVVGIIMIIVLSLMCHACVAASKRETFGQAETQAMLLLTRTAMHEAPTQKKMMTTHAASLEHARTIKADEKSPEKVKVQAHVDNFQLSHPEAY
jgi:hypothetical protein